MAAPKCPNPQCEYFNRTLPNTAQVCPMCGTPLGNVVRGSSAASTPAAPPPVAPPAFQQTPAFQSAPAYQQAPPVYQPSPPVYQSAPPAYQPQQPQVPARPSAPAAAPGRPSLKLIHSPSNREFPLRGEESYIGRRGGTVKPAPEIDLTGLPNDQVISRPHARIYWDATYATYTIIDSNSRNGTFINAQPLTPGVPYQLVDGDALQLGKDNLVQFTVAIA
ncbi:FHA domain-containing protein [Gloeobacter kilaueensis]|uniref:FHA domain-containing protein n=1 Tax=Gloeobacter kilaueensis (strain ATCC BAA-2537 / CCAP 1431/1 / ULC 316 / JS1) TaxID=1183438 RepID=U5QMV5_GLOK1|nr:FHA domain-containing protein [Gloeobacter kilaueensis]AGY58924.1 FHA domain-containing protein [Gloeobacter kilaueensis JS1]